MKKLKVRLTASFDWSLMYTLEKFLKEYPIEFTYQGEKYQYDFGFLKARPLKCGEDTSVDADVIIDRSIHWNNFYKFYLQTAANNQALHINNPITNDNLDKHHSYDLMARGMHPKDEFPTTVLLPQFAPWTPEQLRQDFWETEQHFITSNTKYGWDRERRFTDWDKVKQKLEDVNRWYPKQQEMRSRFYPAEDYIRDAVDTHFGGKFPIYFKKAFGGGGSDVYRVKSMEELYEKYDESGGKCFFLQESIEDYDEFVRCMGIGPEILALRFQPDEPLHQHYSPAKLKLDPEIWKRIEAYVRFINSFYGWTYNSFECLVKDGVIYPIDFANACPDSNFTSLHTHFPWLICSLLKWTSFVGAAKPDLKTDTRIKEFVSIFNDPEVPQQDKYDLHALKSHQYFQVGAYNQFVDGNFKDLEQKMIEFYDNHFDGVIRHAIECSDFPESEHTRWYNYYKDMMENQFRPNAVEYLTTDIHN